MMNFTFENQGTNTFLVYEIGAEDELDTMSLGMLTNNEISGLAAASFTQMDDARYIKFNVSSKISATQLFSGPVNKKRLIGVFTGIINAILSAEDYMLDLDDLLLDLDYIFTDVSTCETEVVCLPILNHQHSNPDLGMFFKNIIFRTQFDQTENCDHVAQIINYLNSAPALSLTDFKDLLEQLDKGKNAAQAVSQQPVVQHTAAPVVQQTVPQTNVQVQQQVQQQAQIPHEVKQQVQQQVQQTVPQNNAHHGGMNIPHNNQDGGDKFKNLQFGSNYKASGQKSVPGKKPENKPQTNAAPENEKEISLFYLLQHYNKDNAAAYKAQQDAKKNKKGAGAPSAPKNQPKVVNKNPAAKSGANFAMPGKESSAPTAAIKSGYQQSVNPGVGKSEVHTVQKQQPVQNVNYGNGGYQQVVQSQTATPINFGETMVLNAEIGATTVLSEMADPTRPNPHLIRMKNNERIPLNKPVFRIGKERSYVDYFIGDNTAISRSHANIINENGEFYVMDTNSTNHTYVNGGMIQSNVNVKLSHGTKIRLANEDFEFKMY